MSNFLWEFNWNGDGSTWTNEADYALGGKFYLGFKPGLLPTDVVAEPGQFVMHLDNSTQRFSPDYASGALYGNLIPRRRFRLRRTDGVTTWPVWSGYIDKIEPQAGVYSERECVITCIDTPALLALSRVSMGLLRNRRADEIISIAVNLALGAPCRPKRSGHTARWRQSSITGAGLPAARAVDRGRCWSAKWIAASGVCSAGWRGTRAVRCGWASRTLATWARLKPSF
jgi:hypothetical protein